MITMPVFFTSTAMMPYDQMPEWLRVIAHVNPLSYAIDGIRVMQAGTIPLAQIAVLSFLCICVLGLSVHVFRKVKI